jgi:hypothetical protein
MGAKLLLFYPSGTNVLFFFNPISKASENGKVTVSTLSPLTDDFEIVRFSASNSMGRQVHVNERKTLSH